eukprot:3337708-Ditylum_brightwellii.AAC.2
MDGKNSYDGRILFTKKIPQQLASKPPAGGTPPDYNQAHVPTCSPVHWGNSRKRRQRQVK